MPSYIVKLQRDSQTWYLEYSSVVDAPTTFGLPLEDFTKNYLYYYGQHSKDELTQRLARVEKNGTSCAFGSTPAALMSCNRAGLDETKLTLDQIIDVYCLGQPNFHGHKYDWDGECAESCPFKVQ